MLWRLGFVLVCSTILGLSEGGNTRSRATGKSASDRLTDLCDRFWNWYKEESPDYFSIIPGLNFTSERLEDYTPEAFLQRHNNATDLLLDLKSIPTNELSSSEKITYELILNALTSLQDGYEYRRYSFYNPVNLYYNPLRTRAFRIVTASRHNKTSAGLRKILQWYQQLPQQIDDIISMMNTSIEKNTTVHMVSLTGVIAGMDRILNKPLEKSVFMRPFGTNQPVNLRNEALELVRDSVVPAWKHFRNWVDGVYMKNTRPHVGVWSMPGGEEFYEACLSWHLGVSKSPEEIHKLGLSEVKRIEGLMKAAMKEENNEWDNLKDFMTNITNDPKNHLNSTNAVEEYSTIVNSLKSNLYKVINVTDDEFDITVVAGSNPRAPPGQYSPPPIEGPGSAKFTINKDLPSFPKFRMASLSAHEAVPGHHTQKSHFLKSHIPEFRKFSKNTLIDVPFTVPLYTSYIEGWALYAEDIAEEMGAYDTKYSIFGKLEGELLRACRLVVDTGLHSSKYRWSKLKAIEYLTNHTTLSRAEIINEVDRYISLPGQACAYKIGELEIKDLREEVEGIFKNLENEEFDEREFHEFVLDVGPAPLHVMKAHVVRQYRSKVHTAAVTGCGPTVSALWCWYLIFPLAALLGRTI